MHRDSITSITLIGSNGMGVSTCHGQLIVLVFALAICHCSRGNPTSVHDTSGAVFGWSCTSDAGCNVTLVPDSPAPAQCGENEPAGYSYFRGSGIDICPALRYDDVSGWGSPPELCRFLACHNDDECPLWDDRTYECHNGLCEFRYATSDFDFEIIELCLAAIPRVATCADIQADPACQTADKLASQACPDGGTCTIPESCLQP